MTGLGIAALAATASVSQATTITFSNLHAGGSGITFLPTYQSQGFLFSSNNPHSNSFASPHAGSQFYAGSTGLAQLYADDSIILTTVSSSPFSITSIDLSDLYPGPLIVGGQPVVGPGVSEITFTGTKADASTVTQTFTVDAFGFSTFAFDPSFTNLVSLTWTQVPDFHQFDNLVVNEVGVPEPGGPVVMFVGIAALGALAFIRRPRAAGASAA